MSHEYAVSAADVTAAVGAGSLFVARGAMPSSVLIDFREGGSFSSERGTGGRVTGMFTRVMPAELVEFQWAGMLATLRVTPTAAGARLHLTHSGIPTEEL